MMKSNIEAYLQAMINDTGTDGLPTPKSRIGKLLYVLCGKLGLIQKAANTQANWEQLDETAPDYVKGRTHYESIKRQFVTNAFQPFGLSTDETVWYTQRFWPSYSQYETGTMLVYKLVTITDHVETTIAEYVAEIRERGASDNTNVAEKYVGNAYLKGRADNPGLAHDEIVALGYPDTGEHFYRGGAHLIFSDVSILSGTKADIGIYKYKQISVVKKLDEKYIPDTIQRVGSDVIVHSSTAGSTKKFKLTVDDAGTIAATEVTEE